MKKNKKYNVLKDAIKIKEDYGLSDEEMDQYVPSIIQKRDHDYRAAVAKRYGKKTYAAASKWWMSLSPREQKATRAEDTEEIIKSFLENSPGEADSKTIKRAITTKKIRNDIFDEIPPPDRDWASGNIVPARMIKIQKNPPKLPSPEEQSRMSSKEIGKLISEARSALNVGDEDIPGIEGVRSD